MSHLHVNFVTSVKCVASVKCAASAESAESVWFDPKLAIIKNRNCTL